MTGITIEFVGHFHGASGDLSFLTHPDGRQARVYVDSVGETWVDVRRIPGGGYFHTERVDAFRAHNGAAFAERGLIEQGFTDKRVAQYAHRVIERGF